MVERLRVIAAKERAMANFYQYTYLALELVAGLAMSIAASVVVGSFFV